jgi:cation diffusion facilitator CzcD-associated flavoprotein CzcO
VDDQSGARRATPNVAILGAGMSGMCMGIQLKRAGIASFTIFEKTDNVGGTWRDNRYPGVACDVPSHLYSFSFELNPEWSRAYSPGWEIQQYCERCAEKYGLGPHLRFGMEIARLEFVDDRWRIRTTGGEEFCADVVVSALGGLHRPNVPDFPGLETFSGAHFHSARWNREHDLRGRRVAVIGSAASAIQIVPQIARETERLFVFQRTPNWIVPRRDRAYSARTKRLFHTVPGFARLYRALIYAILESSFAAFLKGSFMTGVVERQCRRYMKAQVSDPQLRRALTPSYPPGCKRLLISDDFYPALARDDVELVTRPIDRIVENGIVTSDGTTHEVDTIVFATGFQPFNFLSPLEVAGLGGRTLSETWAKGIEAHRTVAVPGFPNFFMLLGPNSGLGHNSVIIMIEAQVKYVLRCLRALMQRGLRYLDPRPEAARRFNAGLQDDMQKTIWTAGCKSWYMDDNGKVFALWPRSTIRYRWEMRRPDLSEYDQRAG